MEKQEKGLVNFFERSRFLLHYDIIYFTYLGGGGVIIFGFRNNGISVPFIFLYRTADIVYAPSDLRKNARYKLFGTISEWHSISHFEF